MKTILLLLIAGLAVAIVKAHPAALLILVPIVLLLFRARSRATSGAMTAHIAPGHYPAETARHEAGHVVAARRIGGRVTSAVVNRDGSGYVRVSGMASAAKRIGFLRAGEYAIHSGRGASADRAAVRAILREVPKADRARVLREGERIGRSAARSSKVSGVASKLARDGRL
jgi:hypothetical protein